MPKATAKPIQNLTEKQLLAMPEEAYMSKEQQAYFKTKLINMKEELLVEIADTREAMQSNENEPDPLDAASNQERLQLGLRRSERQTKLLHKVEAALKRIDEGSYGYCEETGEPIGLARLLARPTATLSIHAKELQEHRERTERGE